MTLAKVYLWKRLQKLREHPMATVASWGDDISVDVVHKDPQIATKHAVAIYTPPSGARPHLPRNQQG